MCVIVYANINGQKILAKNRDRIYDPNIQIHHTILKGVEVAYYMDEKTNWIEGINEYGICMVNSALKTREDELDGNRDFRTDVGPVILNCLTKKTLDDAIRAFFKNEFRSKMITGFTMFLDKKRAILLEIPSETDKPIAKDITQQKKLVLTNHGLHYPNTGYMYGRKRVSSIIRKLAIDRELEQLTDIENILRIMRKNYQGLDPRLAPYRDRTHAFHHINKPLNEKSKGFQTTSQILFNPEKLEFIFNYDSRNCKVIRKTTSFPVDYTPKITIRVTSNSRDKIKSKLPFPMDVIPLLQQYFHPSNMSADQKKQIMDDK